MQVARKHYDVAREALNDPRVEVRPGDAIQKQLAIRREVPTRGCGSIARVETPSADCRAPLADWWQLPRSYDLPEAA